MRKIFEPKRVYVNRKMEGTAKGQASGQAILIIYYDGNHITRMR